MASDYPTEALTPKVTEAQIVQLLKDKYRLTALGMKPLDGYHDKNFHVQVDTNHDNQYIERIPSPGYFVKISNIIDSSQPQLLYAHLSQMKYLTERGFKCQPTVKNVDGDELTDCVYEEEDGTNFVYKISVREFLPGKLLGEITMTTRHLYDVGVFVAGMSQALQDFHSPAYDNYNPHWLMSNALKVNEILHVTENNKRRQMCEEVLKAFEDQVIPAMADFRKGQIHGDLNEFNLLVSDDAESKETLEITGLLDLQDSARAFFIYDLAICTFYMMLMPNKTCPQQDVPGHVLAGYLSLLQITESERRVFKILIATRMVQSLNYGLYNFVLNPNNDYILRAEKTGWDALTLLWEASSDILEKRWDEIIASYNK